MILLNYVSACCDSSGYAAAARGYIGSLLGTKEVNLTCEVVSFEAQKTTHGQFSELIKPLMSNKIPYKIQIVHLTPENFPKFVKRGIYSIGYCAWETDKLPNGWVDCCNTMDELWVPSDYNVEVFKNSGVVKPVYKILHGIEPPNVAGVSPMEIGSPNTYVFYTICQFIERKNPIGLLKAYLTEFQNEEDVTLVLKSYRLDTSPKEQEIIKNHVGAIKKALNLEHFPPITFFGNLLPREYIQALHLRGDCFVLPVRSEGFGITQAEAMAYGKPVITTRYGGILEFMNDENSLLVNYQMTPVYGMIFGNYNGSMCWADPDIMDIRKKMRWCFENKKEAQALGTKAQKDILRLCSWKKIGQAMLSRLNQIQEQMVING